VLVSQIVAPEGQPAPAPLGLLARLAGVLTSPRATYEDVVARPRSLGMLALVVFVSVGGTAAFLSTEVGRMALLDREVRSLESFGRTITEAQYQQMQRMLAYAPYLGSAGQLIVLPLGTLALAGLAYVVFALLGGEASFGQIFAVLVHSSVVLGLKQLFALPLDYVRESFSNPTNLAVFLPMLDEASFGARLLGAIDLFQIWWVLNLAIGLGVLYRRRTAPIAGAMLAAYLAIALAIAIGQTALSGS
jgi:hypothetical protein